MEGKKANSDSDVGPPLKKARYQWQVKKQKLKENDEQLKLFQENVTTCSSDSEDISSDKKCSERIPTENIATWSPDGTESKRCDEKDSPSSEKKTRTDVIEYCEGHLFSSPVGNSPITLVCHVNDRIISNCTTVENCMTKPHRSSLEILEDDSKQLLSNSTISSNENTCSCSSETAVCNSSYHSHVPCSKDQIDSLATTCTLDPSNKAVLITEDNLVNGNLSNSSGITETGTSGDFSDEEHENSSCENPPNILAIESSNMNFIDLIQTKVDIQARKLNLLNMVQSNRHDSESNPSLINAQSNLLDGTSSEDSNSNKPVSLSHPHASTSSYEPSTDTSVTCSTGIVSEDLTDEATSSGQSVGVSQHSPQHSPQHLDVAGSPDDQSFLSHWQSQHTAKAIVDNAINKTLEEMGLTPDVRTSAWSRLFLEDEGISEAIRLRGLWLRENNVQSDRIHPIVTQITGASEQVFHQSLENAAHVLRPVQREILVKRNLCLGEGQVHSDLAPPTVELENNVSEQSDDDYSSDCEHRESGYHIAASQQALAAADEVLQCALNAAITSKGLSFQNNPL